MSNPLVSVIISTYNSEKFIKGRIEDLLAQTIKNKIEVIIAISGSEENEEEIVKEYCSLNDNIKYVKTVERETIYKAWNRALKMASGKYITNANTDDRLRKDALEILSDTLEKYPDVAMVYADQYYSSVPNQKFDEIENGEKYIHHKYSKLWLFYLYMLGSQPMWRASLHYKDNLWFDEQYEICGDSDFACRVAEHHNIKKVNKILGVYYRDPNLTNKEFQNKQKTLKESLSIKHFYGRRYLKSLNEKQKLKLKISLIIYRLIPNAVNKGIRIILSVFKDPVDFYPKIFMYWIASLFNEEQGNIEKAKKYCSKFLKNEKARYIYFQYQHLTKLENDLQQCKS